jgi:hypothetical protein
MARGTTLTVLLALLKAELRDAQETNSYLDTEYGYALANKQKDFALAYDWPFLKHDWDLACGVGSRYLAIPTTDSRSQVVTPNFERPMLVQRKWGQWYEPVCYGIGPEQYNLFEGTTKRQDPIQRWQFSTNVNESSNADQIEVWPSPNTAQTLRFTGQRTVRTLSTGTDTADLDDLLLVYFVAADYLGQREQANAALVLKKANDHLIKLRASYPKPSCPPTIIGKYRTYDQPEVKLIAVAP